MSLKCELVPYGGNSDLTIFSSFTTLLDILQGDLLTLRILDRSAEYYQTVINTLEHKLSQAQNAIKEWEILQPLMIKCFCFFDSDDVKFQLYGQAKRFAALERAYKLMITKIEGSKSLGSLVEENSELTSAVTNIKDGLIKLVNDIQFWLDNLRVSFPRLYFLSDDELLTLLSVGKNPSTIEKHLKKNANECYKIHSLKGKEGEVLKLRNIISTNVGIELWLSKIEQEMKNTMKEMLWSVFHDIHDSYEFNPITFYQHYGKKTLGQICFLSARILHTKEMETYVKLGQYQTMKRLGERSRETIAALIKLGPALFSTPNTFKSIVSLEMYYRDWNNELFVSKVKNKNAHSWIKGIKYYFDQEDMILTVNQSMGSMHYGFEYFGGTKDYIWNDNMINCFLTVWSSLDLKLGVFAHGDYASGKKSTLKEFANAVGHFAVLITCNEKSSIADLNRILTGVITSNSFCIFDKLHNQNSNVLSHLVKTIIFVREASQRQDLNSISFFGRTIKIPTFFGFLATIQSSALNNYETYSVVQSQLRSVSLIKPAFGVIAQGLLCINCFKESQILGMKLEEFFLLAKDYLSFQEHYDYSIRTLIAVIQCITQMKPKAFDSESHLIAEALMKYFLPKTILEDVDILKSLIQKTFPMVPLKSDIGLRTCSTYLQDDEATILLNAIQCGNPCLVLGSASCGKSTLIKKISKDLGKKLFCVNPEVENLLAFVQANSFIYEPSEPTMSENWLIIEAPDVKQSWADDAITMIESSRNNTIIIETDNLSGAYAYFVSRFQIVYLKSKWKWQVGLDLWLKSISVKKILTLDEKKLLKICFNRYMDQVFILVHNMGTVENSVVFQGLLRLLQALLLEKLQFRNNRIKMEDIFIFALIWAIGPTYSLKNQNKFVTILKEIFENSEIGDNLKFLKENNQSLFDLFLDLKTGKWRYWLDSESIPFNSNMKYTRSKYKYIADLLLRSQYNVLLMGEIGVRKTTTGMELLSNFSKNSLLFFESITKYSNSIERLTSYFQTVLAFDEDTAKYCATNGRKLIMFIDDLQNQENHQSMNLKILEYLRFIIGCKGFYNKSKIFKQMTNVSIITAIDCKSGNVKSLSNRLLRHFNVMYLPEEDFITGELTDYFIKQINENDANTDDIKNVTSQILSALNASIQVYAQFATKGISRIKSPLVFFSTFDIEKSFSPLLVYTKNPKDIVNINVPDLWVHESNKTYKSRLDSTDLLVYQDILQKVYFLNFHQPLKYENNIYSAIVLCNRAVNEKTFIRGFYQPIGKNFIENIKFLTEKLSTDKLRNMQLMPNSTEILCHIDSTLENKKYLEIILSEIGTEVVMDYIKIVKYFRDFDLKIFQVEINESENIWKNFFKNIVRKASLSDKTTIICVRFTIGCACKEIWEDIHCFINSGKTYQLWNNNEYDDLVQKFHTSEQRKIGKIAHCNITENEILLASVRLCDHLQDKLRFVICIDRSDSLSINCLTENYRALALGKLLLVKKLSALEYAILGKNEYISKKHLNEASISEISRIAGKTFLESQTSWKKSNSVDIFTLELFEKLIEIFNSNIAERSVFLQKHSDSLTFAQEKLQNKIEKLKGTIDSARMGLEEFPVTIKNISRELEFQKSKLMQCQELFQQASKSLREKEDQVGKILSQEQRDLKHRSLDEEKQKFIIAVRALHAVTKNDIEDFKSFVSPPSAIMQLCEALCILFDRIPGWAEAKSLLSSNTIIQKMSSLEFKTVSDLKFERIKRYEELLFPRIQGFQSAWVAARTFGIWFCALVRYMNEIKISESLSKSSKKNELKLSKVLNEKLEQERLSNELKTCERKYNSLLLFKQKNLGKYTLIKEMFAAHSVFDDKSIGREKQLSESQWIQQVFHCDNDLPVFSDKTVALKHELYQRELLNVAKIKNEFDNPSGVAMKYMEDISNKLEKISYAYLQELFSIHSPTNFEIRAKEIILRFLDLRSDTSVKALYENQSKSNLTPLSPVQSCIGSIYIRDFMKSLYSFVSGCEHLANELKAAQANLTETKKSFDECWMNIYSENLEIWTMEDIITKFQEIRKRILNTKNMESHTAVHSSHPLLHKLLLVACSTTDYKESEAENFHTFISKNPNKFLKTLSEYRANDEKLNDAINLHIRPMCEISNLIPAVEEKGFAFTINKNPDWKLYFKTMLLKIEERTPTLLKQFRDEMKKVFGLESYKRVSTFLTGIVEFVKLEKISKSKELNDTIDFEFANHCFITIEEAMTAMLIGEAISTGHRIISAKEAIERKSSLRNRIVYIQCQCSNGVSFEAKPVHSLILKVAHKYEMLVPQLEKIRRQMANGSTQTPIVRFEFPQADNNLMLARENTTKTNESIYILLAEYFKIIYSFHRGVEMGKFLQFQDRFFKSMIFLNEKLKNLLDGNHAELKLLPSTEFFKAAYLTFAGHFPKETRDNLLRNWKQDLNMKSKEFCELAQIAKEDSYLFNSDFMQQNKLLVKNSKKIILFLDPNSIAEKFLANIYPDEKEFEILNAIDVLSSKNLFSSNCRTALLKFYEFEVKTPIINLVAGILKSKKNIFLSTFTNKSDIFENCLSKNLGIGLEVIDISLNSELTFMLILDIIMETFKPRAEFRQLELEVKNSLHSIVEKAVNALDILEDVDCMLEVIHLKRKFIELEEKGQQLKLIENESNLLLEPYRSFAKFCNDLYWIVQNSSKIDKFYIFKDNMFEGILHSCIKHNTNDETTELNSVLADKIAMMMIENLTKISRAFPEIDQGPFLCSLLISKAEYLCEISSNMVEFFKKIISKLSSGGLDKNFTIFMWISDEFMPQALTNKVFKPSLVDAFELIAKQKENWQSQLQQLINLKSDPFTTSLIYLLYSPTCFLSMINLNFPNLSGIISKNLPVFKDQSYESKNMLVITYSIRGAIHKVNHTFAKLDQSHNQLLIFNDEDKLDNAWFDKLTFAINNGNWVLICLDEYWTSNLPQILQNTVLAATGFHLWLIATIHQKDNLPNWLPKFCDVVFEETPKNASIVSQDLMFKILDEETKPTKMYDVRIFMLIKFHAMIVFYQDRLLPYTPFSDMDLKFAIKKFNQSINCGIPRILQRELVLEEVYIPKLKSKASISFMLEVWKLSVELFDKSFPVIYEVPITGLEEVFWKVEPELFRQEVKKTLNLTQPKHVRIVSYIAKKFQNLFGLAKSSSTQIVNFTVLENFINTIPNDNHLRLLMETKINDNYNLFLREEVINLRQFTKASRDVLIKLYNSNKFLKSGNILDWVTSKLPMYPHIQKMNMEDWIILLEHISTHLLNWITLGKPKHINTNLIISLPKFFKEILGFKLDNFMEMNVLSKENLPHCSNNNFIIHGLLLEGGSIENKGVMTCHGFSENLPPVQFRSKVDFPAEKYKKTTIPLHCGKEDLLARVKQYDNQTVGGILINSNNTGLMQKGNLSVVARNAEELANISNSNYNVSKLNWPNAFISTKGAKLQKQITICICSTDDCENERHLFFEKIFPALAKYFEENSVKLHFVDIKWENFPSHCSKEETLLSSLQQMDRSDILVILAGSKTGSKFNSSQLAAYSQLSNGSFNLPLSNLYDFEIQVNYGLKKFPDNHLVYARDPRYAASVPKSFKSQYEADDFCSGQAMEDLKKVLLEKKNFKEYNCHFSHIENKGVKMGGLEHLKNWAINDLTSAINAHLEKNAENTKKMLLIPSLEMYVEKTIQYCKNVEDGFSTIIYGISGIGKCTVLQKISENLKKEDYIVLEAAIGQEEIIIEQLIYSFILKLGEDLKSCNVSFLKGRMEVEKMFLDLLSSAKQQSKKVAVIMHSVEKVKNNLDSILWLSRLLEFNKKMENGAFWLFSTADLDIANNFKINHQNIVIQEINSVQLEDFEFLATNLNNPKIGKSIADSNYCKTIFHANLIVWELQKMRYAGVLVKAEKLPKTHMDILIKNLEQLEESKNGQIITKLFSGLATSRSGLYEDEILEIFQLHFSNWNLIYNEVQYFLKINKDGKITLYHSIFHKLICKRYLKLEEKIFWNEKLAEFFQQKFKKPTRIVDSAYHLLKSQCTASKFVKIIASIKFIEASYFIGLGNDIPLVFSKALKIAKAQEDYSSVKRIKEFIYFFQTNHSVLRETPSLTFTLALNLPIGTIESWDLNSYLPICTVLDKPFPPKSIKDCCFTLNGAERAIMACNNGDICVFDLMPPKMIFLAPSKNNYGALLLASSNLNGVWVQNERRLDWVKFENTSLMLNQPKVLTSKPLNQSLFIEVCDKVLVRSLDQQKAVIFSSKSEEIIVINLMKMKEISRFKDKFIDSAAKGKFSNSKDLLALSRKDQAIMVWKLDTHSRHSLMKSQPDLGEIKSICFSGDEKFIFCGYHDSKRGYITMGNVILGNWLRIIAVSNDCPIYHLSICTILGEERFFSVWKDNIYCCDPRSVISVVKSNALVEEKTRHSGMVKQIYLTSDSGLISASSENEIYVWQNNPEKGKILIFQHQYKFSTKINYLQLFTQLKLCFIATENFVYIYKYSQTYKAEILKVEHSSEVKSVTINCYNENKYEIQMVTITTDDVLRCWTMEYSDPMKKAKILFEKESVQFLPQNPFISDGKKLWIVQNYHNLVLINSRTGEELEIFTTWGQENINEVSISNDATDDNELNPVQNIAISTENTIYFNFEVWSSGGRYEDKYRITGCNYDPISNNIGYSAFESSKNISDLDVNQSFQDKSKIESRGILVILSVSLKKRIFTFIQSSRILFWEFLKSKSNKSDKNTEETISNKIVTIGEDTVLRIFDIENLLDENLFKKQLEVEAPVLAQYPLNCKTSYLTVANSAPLIYIGNENGQVIILKFCVNSLIIESEEM
ncbi:Dynein heavy chain 6, axonemal [Clydaea vesicula]|uniref:Dynein heavy chain 6, axonemal n=1 Tax=Clydaea vesicula TaxID=447962 RepID=A0AAD5UBD5_9FUNG|nr:Dynein heavy chain 6, axonemal [Clydaea vesicula]